MRLRAEAAVAVLSVVSAVQSAAPPIWNADALHRQGLAAHAERRLGVASARYAAVLAIEPPRRPTVEEAAAVKRFAPRLLTTRSEPFKLRDAAAIIHPSGNTIAYHFFWEDDIDFPDDNEPCDHEVVWVRHSPDRSRVEALYTYFHGRILSAVVEPQTRQPVFVQWGKHGSLPAGWRDLRILPKPAEVVDGIALALRSIPMAEYLESAYRKLSTTGRRLPEDALAARLGWPRRFEGTLSEFLTFDVAVDPSELLDRPGSIAVSRFNSATLNRWMIPYNFRPKTEWPVE